MKKNLEIARNIIQNAKNGIDSLENTIQTQGFNDAINVLKECTGKIIISGIGKSANIGHKFASSMTSFGISSTFLDPVLAGHGELGVIGKNDIVILLSKSGKSVEFGYIIDYCKINNINIIAITANKNSVVGKAANIVIEMENIKDGFQDIDNAPMNSASTTLVLCDIIAGILAQDLTPEEYKSLHPAGAIGGN